MELEVIVRLNKDNGDLMYYESLFTKVTWMDGTPVREDETDYENNPVAKSAFHHLTLDVMKAMQLTWPETQRRQDGNNQAVDTGDEAGQRPR
jgi:hypothetical protein